MVHKKDFKKGISENESLYGFSKSITSIKALAIFGIIIYHFGGHFENYENILTKTFFEIGEIGVDIFIFLSGFLLTIGILKTKTHSWKDWYKRRILRIFPLFIISTLLFLGGHYFLYNTTFDLNLIIIHLSGFQSIPTNPNFFLIQYDHWFITLVLCCYIIFPILFYIIRNHLKLSFFLGVILYTTSFLLYHPIYDVFNIIFYILFKRELIFSFYTLFFPRLFEFFFGMIIGGIIIKNQRRSMELSQKRKFGLITFISFTFLILLYIFHPNFLVKRIICFPLIAITFIFFCCYFFRDKQRINQILEIPGAESYEIFLFHQIPIIILLFLVVIEINLILIFLIIPIIIIASIILVYPFFYFGNWLKSQKKYHNLIIIFSLSFITYTSIILLLNLELSNYFSIVLFSSILIILTLGLILKKICTKFFDHSICSV